MCDFSKGFILCKCNDPKVIVHHKKSKRRKKLNKQSKAKTTAEYEWTLFSYVGIRKEQEMGRYRLPASKLDEGLTADFVFEELNTRNCFDFEYHPKEGDNLIIHTSTGFNRIEFIYRDGIWEEDHYSPFSDDCEKIDNGILTTPPSQKA
ncbi:hypothetical protein [uncultured Dokdonia sp.]|uniref:hypothetical protein n=1 Tax=uncultured Dokdonia sp. TaxID=575653 RepID=UPI002618BB61|nr:hypothetical protein [uncultured Dokdonia sp.]